MRVQIIPAFSHKLVELPQQILQGEALCLNRPVRFSSKIFLLLLFFMLGQYHKIIES